jgi:hypothetical protein
MFFQAMELICLYFLLHYEYEPAYELKVKKKTL